VGGAVEPTAKANNNLYTQISGVAGTDLAILTKDFLNNLYINRSIVEFDSHRNVTATTGLAPDPTFTPFIDPSVVYAKSEDSVGEWSVETLAGAGNASTFVWTRAGATNTAFQFSFSVTIVGASPSVNNDLVTFALYLDTGAGFVQVPTSLFDITISGNGEANIASATGVARLNSGFKLQPRMANSSSNNMLIRDFKLSLQEVFTGVA
jgi:hypothetical protein